MVYTLSRPPWSSSSSLWCSGMVRDWCLVWRLRLSGSSSALWYAIYLDTLAPPLTLFSFYSLPHSGQSKLATSFPSSPMFLQPKALQMILSSSSTQSLKSMPSLPLANVSIPHKFVVRSSLTMSTLDTRLVLVYVCYVVSI
jgi:hypothetical protein